MRKGKKIGEIDLPTTNPRREVIALPKVEPGIPVDWPVRREYSPVEAPAQAPAQEPRRVGG